jgi:hypothetical protein
MRNHHPVREGAALRATGGLESARPAEAGITERSPARIRPMASAFQTPDGGWCIHWLACGQDRPICTPGNTEN